MKIALEIKFVVIIIIAIIIICFKAAVRSCVPVAVPERSLLALVLGGKHPNHDEFP